MITAERPVLAPPFTLPEDDLATLAEELRERALRICVNANNGHVGACAGAAELLTVLYFGGLLRFDPGNPRHPERDRVLIRGHLGPLRYPLMWKLGWVDESELESYRRLGSRLQGHEEHQLLRGVDLTPSGSLGMLLSYGVGAALGLRDRGSPGRTFVFLGDGEEEEGNVSEAARHAAHLGLSNLVAILDVNGKQLSAPVAEVDSVNLGNLWRAYGWRVLDGVNGHDVADVKQAYLDALTPTDRPTVVIASTEKGHGVPGNRAHFSGFHTLSVTTPEHVSSAADRIASQRGRNVEPRRRSLVSVSGARDRTFRTVSLSIRPSTTTPDHLDEAQLDYFNQLGKDWDSERDPIYFLTADTTPEGTIEKLSLRDFANVYNVGIREQHLIALTHGLTLTRPDVRVICNTIDAFALRSLDQLQSLAQGGGSVVILGDVAGLTNARNGASHQGAAQPGAVLALPQLRMLEPADIFDLFACLNWAIGSSRGPVYIRIHSSAPASRGWYARHSPEIEHRSWYVAHQPDHEPDFTIIASGFTVAPSVEAARRLAAEGTAALVVSVVDHGSLDAGFAQALPRAPVFTVYNGAATVLLNPVCAALLAEGGYPASVAGHGFTLGTSGTLEELTHTYRLDGAGIAELTRDFLRRVS